jgi:hypothetical protein
MLSLNASSRSVSDNRTCGKGECFSLIVGRVSYLTVLIVPTSRWKSSENHRGRQFRRC